MASKQVVNKVLSDNKQKRRVTIPPKTETNLTKINEEEIEHSQESDKQEKPRQSFKVVNDPPK